MVHLLERRRAEVRPPTLVTEMHDTIIAFYGILKGFAPQTKLEFTIVAQHLCSIPILPTKLTSAVCMDIFMAG
jgi:hypothetical protein